MIVEKNLQLKIGLCFAIISGIKRSMRRRKIRVNIYGVYLGVDGKIEFENCEL